MHRESYFTFPRRFLDNPEPEILKEKWPDNAWLPYSQNGLELTINGSPLTQEVVRRFLSYVVSITFNESFDGGWTLHEREPFTFSVGIGTKGSLENQAIVLLHELGHIYYRFGGSGPRHHSHEKLLDGEAERFYKENKKFVDELLEELKRR